MCLEPILKENLRACLWLRLRSGCGGLSDLRLHPECLEAGGPLSWRCPKKRTTEGYGTKEVGLESATTTPGEETVDVFSWDRHAHPIASQGKPRKLASLFPITSTKRLSIANSFNKTDADSGLKAICRVSNVLRKLSPHPGHLLHNTMMKRSFTGLVRLVLAAAVLTAHSQETPQFLEPIDAIGFSEKEVLELLLSPQPSPHPARVEVGYRILWVYWRNIYGHHLLVLRKDKVYQKDLSPSLDPFKPDDVPYEGVFQLVLSKVEDPNVHQKITSGKEHKGIDVKTMQTSVPNEVADRMITLWDALTRTLQYGASYSGGDRHRYQGHHFIAGFDGTPDKSSGRRLGGVWSPKDGPLFDFANISMKLYQLVQPMPIDPFRTTAWSPESTQREIISSCELLEAKLKKR